MSRRQCALRGAQPHGRTLHRIVERRWRIPCCCCRRLGAGSPLRLLDRPLLERVCRAVDLVVPDVVATLALAVKQALPGQRIVLRRGEYTVGATSLQSGFVGYKAASTVLKITNQGLRISGEPGAVLRGMLRLEGGSSGRLEGLKIIDAGDACVKALAGSCWQVHNCHLQSGHAASVDAFGDCSIQLNCCRLGGEEPCVEGVWFHEAYGSIQEFGISKRACYAVLAKNNSFVTATRCMLEHCSEAGVFLSDNASVSLEDCSMQECATAFVAGYGSGEHLSVSRTIVKATDRLWYDTDRPRCCQWDEATNKVFLNRSGGH